MNMVKTIFIYFLLLLCYAILGIIILILVMSPLTCFYLCCSLASFSKQIQLKPLHMIRLSVIRFHLISNNNYNYYTMTLTFNDIGR